MRRYMIEGLMLAFLATEVSAQPLSGSYTVGPGGTYATLAAAFSDLNTNGASGPVTLLITGDITESTSPTLMTGTLNSSRTLTIRPNTGITAAITLPSTASIGTLATDHVTIDGSNSGGTSRDLTIKHSGLSPENSLMVISTGSSNVAIRNCVLGDPTNPSYYTVDCSHCSNVTIQNNDIHGFSSAGILSFIRVKGTANVITENTISGDQMSSTRAMGITITDTTGTVVITKNRIHNLQTSGNDILAGIYLENAHNGLFKIYNNFIGGHFVATGSLSYYFLISLNSNASSEVFHNTLVLNSVGAYASPMEAANFYIRKGTASLRNNIIDNAYDVAASYCIDNQLTVPTSLTSDNNDLVVSGSNNAIGLSATQGFRSLPDWQAWTGVNPDANSVSRAVTFVNVTNDFHLVGGSVGDALLRGTGTLLSSVGDDIDGDTRLANPNGPYMGADEAATALSIQLTTFTATVLSSIGVHLRWTTASEIDNYGFEIQKAQALAGPYDIVANSFIPGHGTTVTPHVYSYTDSMVCSGQYYYRLKQTDLNGDAHFSEAILVSIGSHPTAFALNQNYPNPFNPSTTIKFELPRTSQVNLSVYDVLGRQMAVLVNERRDAGIHEVKFDGSNRASGVYFYRLQAGDYVTTKRMLLLK